MADEQDKMLDTLGGGVSWLEDAQTASGLGEEVW